MSTFSEEIDNIPESNGYLTNNIQLAKDMIENYKEHPLISTIQKQVIPSNKNSTDENFIKRFLDNLFPYPNIDEIPEIKIKDKDHFQSDEEIKFNEKFDDSRFNKCKNCKINDNKIFCEKCKNNICDKCYINCEKKYHLLMDLDDMKNETENYKYNINEFFKRFIQPKKKEKYHTEGKEKKQINYQIIDKDEINNDIGEPLDYTKDILFIKNILEKNYINYYHYQNIKECYNYLKRSYDTNIQESIEPRSIGLVEEDFIIAKYSIKDIKENILQVFGNRFVENNKDKCKIIINNKKYRLTNCLELNTDKIDNNQEIMIKLTGINNITNASNMFYGCSSLKLFPDTPKWETSKVENMENMFLRCSSLESIPDISNWNTSNVESMNCLFYECSSLKSLPDISKWNIINVKYMKKMFFRCSSLKSLPDLSKWDTRNVVSMDSMFYECQLLESLPDLGNWNTSNVESMNCLFYECSSLKSLPDISKWNISNVKYMNNLFDGCSSIELLPDIFKWNTSNVESMNNLFYKCSSLKSLPDLGNWKIINVKYMNYLFYKCSSLESMPDISNWNTSNVESMNGLFYECSSLKSIPDLDNWNISNVKYMNFLFDGCASLKSLPNISN